MDAYGEVQNLYASTQRVGPTPPVTPWAMYLTGTDRRFRLLCFDHDAKTPGAAAAAARDAEVTAGILTRAGLEPVVCASGPSGGRHVWVALAEGADPETVASLARLTKHLCPTLDLSPLTNAAAGCVRPPGTPHRAGGASEVIAGSVAALLHPTGTTAHVRAALENVAQLVEDAEPTHVPDARRPLPVDAHRHRYLPGPRRPLPRSSAAALDEDAAMGDASAVLWRVLIGAAAARWHYEDVAALVDRPGMAHVRSARDRGQRIPRTPADSAAILRRQWDKAVQHIASSPRATEGTDPTFDDRAHAIAAHVREVQQRADVAAGRWTTPAGPTDRRVLDALCLLALQGITPTIEADIRRLALLAGIGRETARTGLLRLAHDGWISQHSSAEGVRAAHWTIGTARVIHNDMSEGRSQADPRAALAPTGAAERTTLLASLHSHLTDAAHDAFTPGALGHHAGNLYARTTLDSPETLRDLASLTGATLPRTLRALERLASEGLLLRSAEGWRRPACDARAAAATRHGTSGRLEHRARTYALERDLWTWWHAELAWMNAPKRNAPQRRAGHGQLALLPDAETTSYGAHPRRPDGRANYRAARAALIATTPTPDDIAQPARPLRAAA
ncbi:hypothetical protein Bra3105_18470 (plasmid) [Brachybacterium halotolerans subsp. kimchii]|uniref:hypothetical protein n=1 Tax=Brachybacterium halotolerans TaxID=2795215 RepID=UPI001E29AAAC|nr:hypothetical protein [Brachybacterium halotolerans]UEJ84617.1 hypothetical protein Bra3105_18470 [Brachybacterium halotolerans subsp. kimchii]